MTARYRRRPIPRKTRGHRPRLQRNATVALAHDEAFSFYYHANRIALQQAGARSVEFSPLCTTAKCPTPTLLYIGGGYPELYRNELEANRSMRASIRRFIESGGKFYAECGGLMYLAESIDGCGNGRRRSGEDRNDRSTRRFRLLRDPTTQQSILGPAGTVARGHQFHYSRCSSSNGRSHIAVQQGHDTITGKALFFRTASRPMFISTSSPIQRLREIC